MFSIEISDCQSELSFDEKRLKQAAAAILRDAGLGTAQLSIAIVDDATIHRLNREFLAHDYPTDVLSFLLEREGDHLEGEVIASAQTACREAVRGGWTGEDELLLYVIHGTLHLVGHDDSTPDERAAMRSEERKYLTRSGVAMPETTTANPLSAGFEHDETPDHWAGRMRPQR